MKYKLTEKSEPFCFLFVVLYSFVSGAWLLGYSKETIPMSYFLILRIERNNIKCFKEERVTNAGSCEGGTFLMTLWGQFPSEDTPKHSESVAFNRFICCKEGCGKK